MIFDKAEASACEWLESHKDYQLVFADKTESRLQFSCSGPQFSSFFLVCPASDDGNWVVGSDNDSVFCQFKEVRQYCQATSGQHIDDILDRINDALMVRLQADGADVGNAVEDNDTDDDVDEDECDFEDFYYAGEDVDAEKVLDRNVEEDEGECTRFATGGNPVATNRLLADMKALKKSEGKFGIDGSPRGDNLFVWDVWLSDFSTDTTLGRDLREYAKKYSQKPAIELEMTFPNEYPMKPPFVRIIRPRFRFLTGHITVGGSICLQVLTVSGWSPSNDIESILIQIRATIMSDSQAQLAHDAVRPYTESEARDAFTRMVNKYGWNK